MQLPPFPENIPDDIFEILTKEENIELVDRLTKKYDVDEDRVWRFSALLARLVLSTVPLNQLVNVLQEKLQLSSEKAKSLALDVAYEFLWPLSWKLQGVDRLIESLGGMVPKERPNPPASVVQAIAPIAYPATQAKPAAPAKPQVFGGGFYVPSPPPPPMAPATPPRPPIAPLPGGSATVARPGDVSKLLEKNLLPGSGGPTGATQGKPGLPRPPMPHTDVEPKLRGNIVDLS